MINFRLSGQMLTLYPKRILAVWTDLTMPQRNWSRYDEPAVDRKRANVAKWRINRARAEVTPALLRRQAS